jgi:hypothetical protein
MQTVYKFRNRAEYLHNKRDGEKSKIQMGNERRHGTPMSGGGSTDYRANFGWTVPKFAM